MIKIGQLLFHEKSPGNFSTYNQNLNHLLLSATAFIFELEDA